MNGELTRAHLKNLSVQTNKGQRLLDMFDSNPIPDSNTVSVLAETIAIVGTSKCTASEAVRIRAEIKSILSKFDASKDIVISGGASGVDSIAEDVAKELGFKTETEKYLARVDGVPYKERWEKCYKPRNILMANDCTVIYSITTTFKRENCYHCNRTHERTGGCWTFWHSEPKKRREVIVVQADSQKPDFLNVLPKK